MNKFRFTGFVVFAMMTFSLHAQVIPNAGFETWSGGNPTGWAATNIFAPPPPSIPITQSATAHSGSAALRGEVVTFVGAPWAPTVASGPGADGFPVSQRYATLTGWYQFSPLSGDMLSVSLDMFKNGSFIGAGALLTPTAASSYTQFTIPITYTAAGVPDTCVIIITIIGPGVVTFTWAPSCLLTTLHSQERQHQPHS